MLTFSPCSNWPISGELDIMENVNAVNKVYGTLHCGTAPGGPCDENNGLGSSTVPNPPAQGNFHTYTVEVDRTTTGAEVLNWYLDGQQYFTLSQQTVNNEEAWTSAVHNSYFIIMNIAVGGSFPDKVYGATTPIESTATAATMVVDYVAVYNSN